MNIMDLHHASNGVNALTAHTVTIGTNTTTLGAEIDMLGFEALEFFLSSATITDGAYAVSLVESDTSGGAFTAVSTELTLGNADFAAADNNLVKRIGYIGKKRFVKLSVVSTGVTVGGVFAGIAVKAAATSQPVADN